MAEPTQADREAAEPILGPQAFTAASDHPVLHILANHAEAARAEAMQWQPIETAPRDGTRVLAYPVTSMEAGVVVWEPPATTPPMMRLVSQERHDHDGYWRVLLSQKPSPYEPTHWMPLPPPPPAQYGEQAND